MRARTAVLIAMVGAASTTAVAIALQMRLGEAARLVGVAAGSAVVAGAIGTVLLFALRRRPVGIQVAVVALVSVGAVGVGATVAAEEMFLGKHDLDALLVILLAAGTVGTLIAFLLGLRVNRAKVALEAATRNISLSPGDAPIDPPGGSAEFAALAEELERTSRRLTEARERERALDASRRELIAWVSHDLRTPLAGVRAIAEALEDGLASDQATRQRYYRTLRIEAERIAHLVDELFELSVIHAGALRLRMERTSLGDLVSDAVATARASAEAKGVTVKGRPESAPEIDLDPSEVARVIFNLIDNAIRHTPSRGTVWVETGIQERDAYVSVSDQCGGIPRADLARVFDPAFRGEIARTPAGNGGAGLGLAIARGIAEAHHGQITVCNQDGGCRFTFSLPLTQPA